MYRKTVALFLIFFFVSCSHSKPCEKTVLLAILARNKAHTLPKYLECIENLNYNKKAITIYINTNNNIDETENILRVWSKTNESKYKKVIFESHEVAQLTNDQTRPHEWTPTRFSVLGKIRQASMHKALEESCDFYFVADCDNFIAPNTLKSLIVKNRPIISPMLEALPQPQTYSNYFCDIDPEGYWKADPFYYEILNRRIRGTFSVPVVHCTYLIRSDQIPKLTYFDGTTDFEFVIFSRSARKAEVSQSICNEEHFGYLFLPSSASDVGKIDLETEKTIFEKLEPLIFIKSP